MEPVWRGLSLGALGGAAVGIAVAGVWRVLPFGAPPWYLILAFVALLGATIGGAIALYRLDKRPYRLEEWAPLQPVTVLRHATRSYLDAGWTIADGSETRIDFGRRGKPNIGLVVLLLLPGVVPGVVYWLRGSRRLTTTVSTTAVPDGCEVTIRVDQSGDGASASAIAFFNSLHDLVAESPEDRRAA